METLKLFLLILAGDIIAMLIIRAIEHRRK